MSSYVTITDDLNDKGLTPSEKIALALVQGFSQEHQGIFYGSLNYISWWVGCSRSTTMRTLKALEEKGFLTKGEIEENGIRRCTYSVTKEGWCQNDTGIKMTPPRYQNDTDTGIKMTPNNTINNTNDNTISSKVVSRDETIANLQSEFAKTLEPFADVYTPQMLQEFTDYWTAPLQNPTATQVKKGQLLKYQTQETWSLAGRLRTWKSKSLERSARNGSTNQAFRPATNERGETRMVEAYRKANEAFERAVMSAADERRMYELEERRR